MNARTADLFGLTVLLLLPWAPARAPAQAPDAPPENALSGGAPLVVALRTSGPGLRDWTRLVRADLRLVDDLVLVAEADLALEAELTGRVLRVRSTSSGEPVFTAEFSLDEGPGAMRRAAHESADRLLEALTGRRGPFASSLVFARRNGRRRDVLMSGADGSGVRRVSSGRRSATLPGVVGDDVWYSVLDDGSLFLTNARVDERPMFEAGGLSMGVAACGAGLVFSSTRDGNSEIYTADTESLEVRRMTFHDAIDVSPTCHANGELAFVSSRSGMPQIHLLAPGALHPVRVDQPATANQTPVFCSDAGRRLLAFTRVRRGMSVWTLDLDSGETRRVSPEGGTSKDPAFSPDCRLLAYARDDGLWLSSLDGVRRRRVITGRVDTVRWSPRRWIEGSAIFSSPP